MNTYTWYPHQELSPSWDAYERHDYENAAETAHYVCPNCEGPISVGEHNLTGCCTACNSYYGDPS